MEQNKIKHLKTKIKKTYERYTSERTDGKATISDVANFFNIPIDQSRMGDYIINNINYSTPAIEIIDQKNNVFYNAEYTGDANLLDYSGPVQFNSVISTSPLRKEEILYYIGNDTPVAIKLTFKDEDYELTFERENINSVGISSSSGAVIIIRYLQNINYNGKNVKQPLFNKIYKNSYRYENCIGSFEQTYTYGMSNFIRLHDTQDKYTYTKDGNVIYGINELQQENGCKYLRGICFESTNVFKHYYLPFNMDEKNYPLLNETDVNSAMIFKFGTGFGHHYALQVYKDEEKIKIIYSFNELQSTKDEEETMVNNEYYLPNLSSGTISNEEIQSVLSLLKIQLDGNKALETILSELNTFGTKIDIRKGLIQEDIAPISPKLFMNKSFDEIDSLVGTNKDYYFSLAKEQFEMLTNTNKNQEAKPKVLRLNSIQNNKKI